MSAIVQAIINFFNYLISAFQDITLWVQDFFLYIPKFFFSQFCDVLVSILTYVYSLLPPPSSILPSIPSNVSFFLDPFDIPLGLTIIVSSYMIRFLIRRIPFIG